MSYLTIEKDAEALIVIQKSKFLAFAYHVETQEDIESRLSCLRKQHSFATHICFAYILHNEQRFSDDGEPKGTAGLPILDVIKKRNLTNTMVSIVRYFGGTKLGAGGLVRAYSGACAEVLSLAGATEIRTCQLAKVMVDFAAKEKIEKINTAVLKRTEYGEQVSAWFLVPIEQKAAFQGELNEILKTQKDIDWLEVVETGYKHIEAGDD